MQCSEYDVYEGDRYIGRVQAFDLAEAERFVRDGHLMLGGPSGYPAWLNRHFMATRKNRSFRIECVLEGFSPISSSEPSLDEDGDVCYPLDEIDE